MANYSGAKTMHKTLAAGQVDVVTLDRSYRKLQVINRDNATELWFTVDTGPDNSGQATPAAGADNSVYVGPGGTQEFDLASYFGYQSASATRVRLFATTAVAYSVMGLT